MNFCNRFLLFLLLCYFCFLLFLLMQVNTISNNVTVVLPEFFSTIFSSNEEKLIFIICLLIISSIASFILVFFFFYYYFFPFVSFFLLAFISCMDSWYSYKAISILSFKVISNIEPLAGDCLFDSNASILLFILLILSLILSHFLYDKFSSLVLTANAFPTISMTMLKLLRLEEDLDSTDIPNTDSKPGDKSLEELKLKSAAGKSTNEETWSRFAARWSYNIGFWTVTTVGVVICVGGSWALIHVLDDLGIIDLEDWWGDNNQNNQNNANNQQLPQQPQAQPRPLGTPRAQG